MCEAIHLNKQYLFSEGADRQYDHIKDMIGYQPWPFMKYCWQYFTSAICTVSIGNVHRPVWGHCCIIIMIVL